MRRVVVLPILLILLAMYCRVNHSFVRGMGSRFMKMNSISSTSATTYSRNPCPNINVSASTGNSFVGDLLIIPMYKPQAPKSVSEKDFLEMLKCSTPTVPAELLTVVNDVLSDGCFKADIGSKQLVRIHGGNVSIKYVALVGLGPNPKKSGSGELEVRTAARLGKAVAALAKETKASSVAVILPPGAGNAGVSPFLLGVQDAQYVDHRFKKVPDQGVPQSNLKSLTLLGTTQSVVDNVELTSRLTDMIGSGVQYAKDLVGKPFSYLFPILSTFSESKAKLLSHVR